MLRLYFIRWAAAASLLSFGLLITTPPAQASDVQITLNNLAFDSSFSGPEVFNGSFLYDPVANVPFSINIFATGATDNVFGGAALPFQEVGLTNFPFQFVFGDGFGDVLYLNLASGLSNMSYGSADASINPAGGLAPFGFTFENGSSGSFAAGASATTPEPAPLLLLSTGSLLLLGWEFARRRTSSRTRAEEPM